MNKPACDSPKYDCETVPCQDCPNAARPSPLKGFLDQFTPDALPVVYIAGPRTGDPNENVAALNETARRLRFVGFPVLNPADFGQSRDRTWNDNVVRGVSLVGHADILFLMPGWDDSRESGVEFDLAMGLDIPCILAEDFHAKVISRFFSDSDFDALAALDDYRQSLAVGVDANGKVFVATKGDMEKIKRFDTILNAILK